LSSSKPTFNAPTVHNKLHYILLRVSAHVGAIFRSLKFNRSIFVIREKTAFLPTRLTRCLQSADGPKIEQLNMRHLKMAPTSAYTRTRK